MLTTTKITDATPRARPFKLYDLRSLFLLVKPNGAKLWRWRYRYAGREKTLAIGSFTDISLVEARRRRAEAHAILKEGRDPSAEQRTARARAQVALGTTLEQVAREWHATQAAGWTPGYGHDVLRRLELHVFKTLGAEAIADVTAPMVLANMRALEALGEYEIARKVRADIARVMAYAIATDRALHNPAEAIKKVMAKRPKDQRPRSHAAVPLVELPTLVKAVETYDGHPATRIALRLLLLTGVRTQELIGATWGEFDLERAEWRIPAARMKMSAEHVVPLSRQALDCLRALPHFTGPMRPEAHLFPHDRHPGKTMSNNTLLFAFYRLGFKSRQTGHGCRSLFSTWANETAAARADVIERCLAHVEGNKVRAAYNRAEHTAERRALMQAWADHLDACAGRNVVPLRRRKRA